MRLILLILGLLTIQAVAIEMLPSEKTCAAIFNGEVISLECVATLTNRSPSTQLYTARLKVASVVKQDVKLTDEVTIYYVYDSWQVCPRCVELKTKQKSTFYCYRANIGGITNVLSVPSA